jgi:hypothetical protein
LKLLEETTRALTALVVWTGFALLIVVDVWAVRGEAGMTFLSSVFRSLTLFTVLANLLVLLGATIPLLWPRRRAGRVFYQTQVHTGVIVFILIVGLVYLVVLARTWNPRGLPKIADMFQHYIVPIAFLLHWIFIPKGRLHWKAIPLWLVFPAVYLTFILVRGSIAHVYPYPFVDVSRLGIRRVLINAGLLTLGFVVLGLATVGLDRLLGKTRMNQ